MEPGCSDATGESAWLVDSAALVLDVDDFFGGAAAFDFSFFAVALFAGVAAVFARDAAAAVPRAAEAFFAWGFFAMLGNGVNFPVAGL